MRGALTLVVFGSVTGIGTIIGCASSARVPLQDLDQKHLAAKALRAEGRYQDAARISAEIFAVVEKEPEGREALIPVFAHELALTYERLGRDVLAEALLRQAVVIEQRTGNETAALAEYQTDHASLLARRAQFDAAEYAHQSALATRRRIFGDEHPKIAESLNNLGVLRLRQRRFAEAIAFLQSAIAVDERLESGDPKNPSAKAAQGAHAANLARVLHRSGKIQESIPAFERALSLQQKSIGESHPDYAETLGDLAEAYLDDQRYSEAQHLYKESFETRLTVLGATHPATLFAGRRFATVLNRLKRFDQSEPLWQMLISAAEAGDKPSQGELVNLLQGFGAHCRQRGDLSYAVDNYRRALKAIDLETADPQLSAELMRQVGELSAQMGDLPNARTFFEVELMTRLKKMGPAEPSVIPALLRLTEVYIESGSAPLAEQFLRRMLLALESAQSSERQRLVPVRFALGRAIEASGRYTEAGTIYESVLKDEERTFGLDHPELMTTLRALGEVGLVTGAHDRSIEHLARAVRIARTHERDAEVIGTLLGRLSAAHQASENYEPAEALLNESLETLIGASGPMSANVAMTLHNLGVLYATAGKAPAAVKMYERAIACKEKVFGPRDGRLVTTLSRLAELHVSQHEYQAARELFERALKIAEHEDGGTAPAAERLRRELSNLGSR